MQKIVYVHILPLTFSIYYSRKDKSAKAVDM